MSILITKADGTEEPFEAGKLHESLTRAGATKEERTTIVSKVEDVLHPGISTQEIYRLAFELLRESDTPIRARYALRRALFGLGPTGFPFEDYLAKLYTAKGFTTKTRVTLQGHCVSHELDVAAYSETKSFVAEAKFHSRPGIKSDLQVVMYSFARFHDLRNTSICSDDTCGIDELKVITNTKFTSTAEKYAACTGITLVSWGAPTENNLHTLIEETHVYPITVVQGLSATQKQALIERKVITCNDLLEKPHLLRHAHISQKRTEQVLTEVRQLVQE